ncbi:MAG: hypothetical protein JSW28_06705 [Thermoplasmata archaeon]|nr:MAG: hypothetical protein JSW28_06705 [Thermoplasmata archaeon]
MRRMRKFSLLLVMAMLVGMGLSAANPVQAHGSDPNSNVPISLSGVGTATIDGIIDPVEWAGAGFFNFTHMLDFVNGTILEPYPVGLSPYGGAIYVMNDGCYLYIAVWLNDPNLTSEDLLTVTFDDDHDTLLEAYPPFGTPTNGGGEDMIAVAGDDSTEDRYIVSPSGTYVTSAYDPTSSEIMGASSNDGTLSYFELAHPLNSADDDYDFDLSAGDTIGFTIGYSSPEMGETHAWPTWVYGTTVGLSGPLSGYQNAEDFGDIIIMDAGPCQVPADIEIGPETLNLKSNGKWITCHIDLMEGYDENDIDISTVAITEIDGNPVNIPAAWGQMENDRLMVKFDRSDVQDACSPGDVEITVTGEFTTGGTFGGTGTIKVIDPP